MSKVILLVDDEPYILHVLSIRLRDAGYEVVTACDGEEAIEVCLTTTPDLIITDYQMPCLNGLEFCSRYRESSGREIPVILVTAREFDLESHQLTNAGVIMAISKPFSPRAIIELVRDILKKTKPPSAA
ncbi:MAG: response regulator [Phycisphaerae bacterium]|nr:response regulator [Phycisphaerae bacterium]